MVCGITFGISMESPWFQNSCTTIALTLSSRSSSDPVSPVISESGIYSNAKKIHIRKHIINISVSPHRVFLQRTQKTEGYVQKNWSVR